MKLVKATEASQKLHLKVKELDRVASVGEEFEVSDERYEILSGKNIYRTAFVVLSENVTNESDLAVELPGEKFIKKLRKSRKKSTATATDGEQAATPVTENEQQ